ncbi:MULTISPECIES: hypothetical protein [unclassified Butyrivibrio]|uniref:hypothetical protein n=1 Tax=unclassified Butyrivibrio TaxID=2639466 RepID=UPI0003B37457|nr:MULTISPECIES: hypothetical protein [unclassified Butyrivibrio]SDB26743.1 hypothetical protein SAMN02910263_01278 [Butyrivibrio sp. INlla16]SEL26480.1 hypothetical protein SAMN04487770_10831 [Butyrivibrio sp. ob235]
MNRARMQILWTCLCLILTITFFVGGNAIIGGAWLMVFFIQVGMTVITIQNLKME